MTIPNHINTALDAYQYARDVFEGRWKEGEAIIATDTGCAFFYAYEIIKGRWKEGELTIMFSDYVSDYAKLTGMSIVA